VASGSGSQDEEAKSSDEPLKPSVPPAVPPPPRPSSRPSSAPPGPFTRIGRLLFAAAWIATQLVLILTADRRPDGAFGFRMFPDSSSIKVVLYREVEGEEGQRTQVHVEDGVWSARDAGGMVRRFSWYERVRSPYWAFDREMHASYGAAAQLVRLQSAVDDVATHIPDDAETRRLVLEVTVRRNGREPVLHRILSPERAR
jgi:hypothetical protein